MPWKERSIVEERMRFVLRLKDGESMSSLCREFGISRVTGYKIYETLQRVRARRSNRPGANSLPLCPQASRTTRSNDRHPAAGKAHLGRSQA